MILVTGGTGLLGSHLLLELLKSGRSVRAVYRDESRKKMVRKVFSYYTEEPDALYERILWQEADLLDPVTMEEALEGVSEVYHLGAVVSFYPGDHRLMRKVNIAGTANLVDLCLAEGVKKFCYVSSVATLGRAENDGESDEETHWVPSKKNSVYSQTKYAAEQEVWRGMAEGMPAVIVNPSVILGPGYWQENSGLFRLVNQGLKYYTRGMNGYVDARDVVKAMTGLMERCLFGERFIVSAANLSYEELFKLMAKHLGRPAPSVYVPPVMSGIAWRIEAVRSFLTRSKPEVTREMSTTTAQIYTYSNRKIRDALGMEFIPVERSILEISGFFLGDLSQGSGSGNGNSG